MTQLSELIPKERLLLINLVEAAGVDVSDWANFKGGTKKAAVNPRYCYEWSFMEPKKVVVLNLWYASMKEQNGIIYQDLNLRELALMYDNIPGKSVWRTRAEKTDHAIQDAVKHGLPIRVVVLAGPRRGVDQPETKASRVEKRLLDPVAWAVTKYDRVTGQCTVTRGAVPDRYVDQFSIIRDSVIEQRLVTGNVFVRDPNVRKRVLIRAQGICEWCAEPGFAMPDDRIYLETHHIIPLAEHGSDNESNVVALCPNHHREAHYGVNGTEMRDALLRGKSAFLNR